MRYHGPHGDTTILSHVSESTLIVDCSSLEEINRNLEAINTGRPQDIVAHMISRNNEDHVELTTGVITGIALRLGGRIHGPIIPVSPMNLSDCQAATTNSDYVRVLNLMQVNDQFMMLTDHWTHHCILINEKASPDRLIWTPADYVGLDFMKFWKDSMESFQELMLKLRQEGRAENFTYNLRRVDGSLGRYTKTYEIVDFLGRPARLSYSHEWELLLPAPLGD